MAETTYFTEFKSPLGVLLLASRGDVLTGLYFEGHKPKPRRHGIWRRDDGPFETAREQLEAYFAGGLVRFELRTALDGTDFQKCVWSSLRRIPWGKTDTYSHVAKRVKRPTAVRAVGAAIGRNPISIVIPCHRVIGSDGTLTGYAGGTDRKQWLLRHEASARNQR
jgi:methylated-DNA-[protein]-cysteine S-methyltransferase